MMSAHPQENLVSSPIEHHHEITGVNGMQKDMKG